MEHNIKATSSCLHRAWVSTPSLVLSSVWSWDILNTYGWFLSCKIWANPFDAHRNFWHPGTLTLSPERQSARMSKLQMTT